MGDNTPNLNLFRPDPEDSMANVKKNINDNFKAIRDYVTPPAGAAFPGSASVGDLFYLNAGAVGHYICVVNDTDWGLIWRPVEVALGPWKAIPAACVIGGGNVPSTEWPFSIALDNRGNVHFRGAIQNAGGFPDVIPPAVSQLLKTIPENIRPAMHETFLLPTAVAPDGQTQYTGARMDLNTAGNAFFNFWNNGSAQYLFFDTVFWAAGEATYYSG